MLHYFIYASLIALYKKLPEEVMPKSLPNLEELREKAPVPLTTTVYLRVSSMSITAAQNTDIDCRLPLTFVVFRHKTCHYTCPVQSENHTKRLKKKSSIFSSKTKTSKHLFSTCLSLSLDRICSVLLKKILSGQV